ncbi:hypothetical protein CAPTEDRAFT_160588 [Capitella teleta]|uniref:Follistatin-like domain-containing protein n=1 Tax=Capitella teleta TaxID=283909 RepID=R7TBL8_CAPTE|nr:hypothetical protein CAPTEDRAFT_160588 [Capitella teleta]|eukprot:ELT88882.1 hypothetical protein CAPTEDRAFT_160588 [Capitella teleta]
MKAVVALVCLLAAQALSLPTQEQDVPLDPIVEKTDPCDERDCGPGRECEVEDGRAVCVCMHSCLDEEDELQVCSSTNLTFSSSCDLHRQKCLCEKRMSGCEDPHHATLRLDYYGECKEQEFCDDWELEEFPKRMAHWFYLVLDEMAKGDSLNAAVKRKFEAPRGDAERLAFPVIWQFCELDTSHNNLIEANEIEDLTAMLKTQEKCTTPFLRSCDRNDDGRISLREWGKCLGLDEAEVEERCEEFLA